jgi:hypothetical protein
MRGGPTALYPRKMKVDTSIHYDVDMFETIDVTLSKPDGTVVPLDMKNIKMYTGEGRHTCESLLRMFNPSKDMTIERMYTLKGFAEVELRKEVSAEVVCIESMPDGTPISLYTRTTTTPDKTIAMVRKNKVVIQLKEGLLPLIAFGKYMPIRPDLLRLEKNPVVPKLTCLDLTHLRQVELVNGVNFSTFLLHNQISSVEEIKCPDFYDNKFRLEQVRGLRLLTISRYLGEELLDQVNSYPGLTLYLENSEIVNPDYLVRVTCDLMVEWKPFIHTSTKPLTTKSLTIVDPGSYVELKTCIVNMINLRSKTLEKVSVHLDDHTITVSFTRKV